MCENLKDTYPFVQLKFLVYGHMQTYTRQAMQVTRVWGLLRLTPIIVYLVHSTLQLATRVVHVITLIPKLSLRPVD